MNRQFHLYDTLTKTVKPLETQEPGHLRFYSCGPTVYGHAHIGNFRSFLTADLIVRTAMALGWRMSYVSNITDVGHLTEDDRADACGEDKMIKALRSKGGALFANIWELSEFYTTDLIKNWQRLNLKMPMLRPKATQHMREQILAIESLIQKGSAYETSNAVYFSVESFPQYGRLSGNVEQDQLLSGARQTVRDPEKRHPADFALWKKDDKHLMQWYSPWGWGFPGWHLECSVMAMQYLGDTIDLHAGGEDLIFPHHECEIAQSEALTGKPFAKHWVHTRFLQINNEKMSKSTGNCQGIEEFLATHQVSPLVLRTALLAVPYGKPLNFSDQSLHDAKQIFSRFEECALVIQQALTQNHAGESAIENELAGLYDQTLEAMCQDLNTSVALAKAYEMTKVILKLGTGLSAASAASAEKWLGKLNELLGIVSSEYEEMNTSNSGHEDAWIEQRVKDRTDAKNQKNFQLADEIRQELLAKGIEVRDTAQGSVWKRV